MGMVPSLKFKIWNHPRKGKLIIMEKNSGRIQSLRTVKDKSIFVQGPKIFNALPRCIREWEGSFDTFKIIVDCFLTLLPDRPCLTGYTSQNKDLYRNQTNEIVHWIRNKNLSEWKYREGDLPTDGG